MTTPTTAPLLWYTDRSRWETGTSRCPRQRYLTYHSGPTGYGITAKRESLPLVTGIAVHHGLEAFALHLARHDTLPDAHETRMIINAICAEYLGRVEARGYRGILGGATTEETIAEQVTLISGLLWALRLKFLPWFHEQYRVVMVEQERLHFLQCKCGAPPLNAAEHVARGCTGIVVMIRQDLLAKRRDSDTLAYFECKTTGWESSAWAEQWETKPQLAIGTLDAKELWGVDVSEIYIVGLNKGRRAKDRYDAEGSDPRKKQMSPLCYGYARPANPPLMSEDWLPAYEWTTNDGEVKRASRAHKRKGVWTIEDSDWPTWLAYHGQDPEMTAAEFWVRMLPDSLLDKVCFILGPMNRQDRQLESLRSGLLGEEQRWQLALWELYELQQLGITWSDVEFQHAIDRLIPCSWNCRPFGKDHECEFVPICHRYTGWEDPLGSGKYQARLPHHEPELQQAVARGLLPESALEIEETEEER